MYRQEAKDAEILEERPFSLRRLDEVLVPFQAFRFQALHFGKLARRVLAAAEGLVDPGKLVSLVGVVSISGDGLFQRLQRFGGLTLLEPYR